MAGILLQYYQDELSLIHYHLDLVDDDFPMHDIHRVRVGIKRIKAVHRMLESSYPDQFSAKVLNRPYRKTFRSFGRYREAHICLMLLRKYHVPKKFRRTYMEYLEPELETIQENIRLAIAGFKSKRESGNDFEVPDMLERMSVNEEIDLLYLFIELQRKKAEEILLGSQGNEELHQIRIVLKNIKPFLKMLAPLDISQYSRKDFRLLNRTESLIGSWHDRHMLVETLQKFMSEGGEERQTMTRIYNRVVSKFNRRDRRQKIIRLRFRIHSCLRTLDRS